MAKYGERGLRIVSVSSEPASKINSVMIKDLGAKFWMASDTKRTTLRPFGGGGIPHAYLVDAMGKVAWDGHPGSLKDGQIEKLLAQAFDPKLDRELHPSLKGLVKSYTKGHFGKVFSGAARFLQSEERAVSSDAAYLQDRCKAVGAFKRKVVEGAIQEKDYATAYDILKTLPKNFAGMEVAKWATETQGKLDKDGAVQNERKAWASYRKLQAREMKAGGKAKKLKPIGKQYAKLAKKYPGTRAGSFAEKAAARLPK